MKKIFVLLTIVLSLFFVTMLPVNAVETDTFVFDEASILTDDQVLALNYAAKSVSDQYNCGIYIAVFSDMNEYGFSNIEQFSEAVFSSWELGYGQEENGIVLVLSMSGRDYDLDAHGDIANTAFTDYGKEQLASRFIDDFRGNQWYSGFNDYVDFAGSMLESAKNGIPLDVPGYQSDSQSFSEKIASSVFPGLIVALIVAAIRGSALKRKMKSVYAAGEASEYMARDRFQLTGQDDHFTHTTVVRQRIERDSGSRGSHGGTSVNSGGHSHSSGKF